MDISFSIWLDSPGAALESGPSSIERDSSIYILTQYTQFDFMENSTDFFLQCLDAIMDINQFQLLFNAYSFHITSNCCISYFALE
jgi:hypothetical protein